MITFETITPLLKMEFNVSETLTLLRQYGFKFFSWGASRFTNINDKGLIFKVNGHHHKGYVLITLDWTDTYEVHIISTHGNIKSSTEMVYFDMLFDVIDKKIEYIPQYKED